MRVSCSSNIFLDDIMKYHILSDIPYIQISLLFCRWLDKLGVSAKLGVDVVVRQALYGGHYSLLHENTHAPNPVSIYRIYLAIRRGFVPLE